MLTEFLYHYEYFIIKQCFWATILPVVSKLTLCILLFGGVDAKESILIVTLSRDRVDSRALSTISVVEDNLVNAIYARRTMNWTGGTRARHSRPSSDTHRLQKRYFAKVRAAQSSIHSVTHAGPHSVLGAEDSASSHVKRKRLPIPALDIIVRKDGDASQGIATKKRKLLGVTYGVGASTPASSAQSFGNVGRGSGGLRSKKQLLLETDNWVCTTLARPLVLKKQVDEPSGRRRTAGENVAKPLGLDLCEPPIAPVHFHEARDAEGETTTYNAPIYLSPERQTYLNAGEHADRRVSRAFRNLSDGGYVQIGGSTQAGNRTATPHSFGERGSVQRGMSNISEETMLFDLDSRQERYETPPQPSPFSTQPMPRRKANEIFGNEYQAPCVQDSSEDIIYYPRDSRWERVGWNRHVADQFPSSPLAPYSQNIRNQGKLLYKNPFLAGSQEPADSLTGEIERAVADVDPSSPQTTPPMIHLRSEPVTPPPHLQISLPPASRNIRQNSEYQGRPYNRYPTYGRHQVLAPNGPNFFGLDSLCEEEIEGTQNLSLMAYASSPRSAFAGDDEGGSWMLGSNISPEPYEKYDDSTNVSLRESEDDWEAFLRHDVLTRNGGVEHEEARDDAQSYLDQVGIWEKHSGEFGDQASVENQCSDNEEEYRDFYDQGVNVASVISVPNTTAIPDPGELLAATPSLCLQPEEEKEKDASWGGFLEEPLEESCNLGDGVMGHKPLAGNQDAERRLDSCGANNETTVETLGVAPHKIIRELDRNTNQVKLHLGRSRTSSKISQLRLSI